MCFFFIENIMFANIIIHVDCNILSLIDIEINSRLLKRELEMKDGITKYTYRTFLYVSQIAPDMLLHIYMDKVHS